MKMNSEGLPDREDLLRECRAKNKNLLDVGTGPIALIAAKEFDCQVTNIDYSSAALKEARKEANRAGLKNKIKFDKVDASNLPYQDKSFDIVVCYGALHHNDPKKREDILREIFRVSKETVAVSELTQLGFEHIHGASSFVAVDLDWLENRLCALGEVRMYRSRMMNVYLCKRGPELG
jgi:ubiquinone/menaquinone biosynthesis C-methylase UbiE